MRTIKTRSWSTNSDAQREVAAQMVSRRAAGETLEQIAQGLGVSGFAVRQGLKRLTRRGSGVAGVEITIPQADPELERSVLPVLPEPVPLVVERQLARAGVLEQAGPVFGPAALVPLAGLFLALPALEATGLLECAHGVYGGLPAGFYGLDSMLVEGVLRCLAGEPRVQSFGLGVSIGSRTSTGQLGTPNFAHGSWRESSDSLRRSRSSWGDAPAWGLLQSGGCCSSLGAAPVWGLLLQPGGCSSLGAAAPAWGLLQSGGCCASRGLGAAAPVGGLLQSGVCSSRGFAPVGGLRRQSGGCSSRGDAAPVWGLLQSGGCCASRGSAPVWGLLRQSGGCANRGDAAPVGGLR